MTNKELWSKNRQLWGTKTIKKVQLKKRLKFDYSQLMEKTQDGWKLNFSDKKLLSVSSILKNIHEYNFFRIPNNLLDYRKTIGKQFMENCFNIVKTQDWNISTFNISELERKHLNTFFKWIIANEMKIICCEKMITNGCLIAFLDFAVRTKEGEYFILEIKLRNSLEVKPTDIFQLRVYCEMLGCPGKLVLIGDNGEIKVEKVLKSTFKKELNTTIDFYKQFGIDLYFENRLEIGDTKEK